MAPWKRTFISAFLAQILSIVGFSFAMPFLPFFIADLGVTDQSEQAFWAGIVMSATGVTLGLFAPIWGILADRYGRKAMVVRAMFGGTIVLTLMSLVQSVGQLVVCRLLQGALTGTVAASVALVAGVTPQRRSGFALGMMQAAVFLGVSLGPLAGGIVADQFGYRMAFRLGAVVIFLGAILVSLGTVENFSPPDLEDRAGAVTYGQLLTMTGFMIGVGVLFSVRLSTTMANPSFPLIVRDLLGSDVGLNSVTGSIIAAAALAGAGSAALLGYVGDDWGHKRVLIGCSLLAAAASVWHAYAFTIPQLFAARIAFGLSVAGMLPAANTLIRRETSERNIGKAFGAATALSMGGLALGPYIGGLLGQQMGLRSPFLATAVSLVCVAAICAIAVRPGGSGPEHHLEA